MTSWRFGAIGRYASENAAGGAAGRGVLRLPVLFRVSVVGLVPPEALVNLSLEGVGDSAGKSIAFMPDGVLEITNDDGSFVGEWEYSTNSDSALLPLRIAWMVEDEQHGYITNLSVEGDTYQLFGYWYVTDQQINLLEVYQVAGE